MQKLTQRAVPANTQCLGEAANILYNRVDMFRPTKCHYQGVTTIPQVQNFSLLYDLRKQKEIKDDLKMQCTKLHNAMSDGDSHSLLKIHFNIVLLCTPQSSK